MAVKPAAPHRNGVVSRPGALHLGRLIEETRPVYIERLNTDPNRNPDDPEYVEVELTGWWYTTVRGEIKVKLRALHETYQKIVRPDPDDIDPEDGNPRFVPNQAAWERYIAGSLALLVPDMTDQETAFLANWGHNSERAREVLAYLGHMSPPTPPAEGTAEGAPNPEAGAATS